MDESTLLWSNPASTLNWLHDTTFLCDDHHTVAVPEPDSCDSRQNEAPFASLSILLTRKDGHCLEYQVTANASFDDTLGQVLKKGRADVAGLALSGTNLTDDGLQHLKGLHQLSKLELDDTEVTDTGLQVIAQFGLASLRELNLTSTKITDAGIESISLMRGIDHLRLEHTAVTNETLKCLRSSHLTVLNMGYSQVNDMGLIWLQDMPNLKVLSLAGTRISDDGLKHLVRCRRLQVLNLEKTDLAEVSVQRLKKKMPACLIVKPDGMFLN